MKLKDINCVLLCGGLSSRMKTDKSLLDIQNKSLAQFQVDKYSKIFKNVFLSLKNDKFNNKFKLIKDLEPSTLDVSYSPMLGLYSALKYFNDETVFILSIDMPSVLPSDLEAMLEFVEYDIVIAKTTKTHNLCGFYKSKIHKVCQNLLLQNQHKISLLFSKVRTKILEFSNEENFVNLNFPSDYQAFIRTLK